MERLEVRDKEKITFADCKGDFLFIISKVKLVLLDLLEVVEISNIIHQICFQ